MMHILSRFEEQNLGDELNGSSDGEDPLSQLEGVDFGLHPMLSWVEHREHDACQILSVLRSFGHGYPLHNVQLSKTGYVIPEVPSRSNC
jgi:hypothetical protein